MESRVRACERPSKRLLFAQHTARPYFIFLVQESYIQDPDYTCSNICIGISQSCKGPSSRLCGTRPCMLLCGPSVRPDRITADGLADEPRMVLDAMALVAGRLPHRQWHQRDRGQEGEDHGRGGRRREAFI